MYDFKKRINLFRGKPLSIDDFVGILDELPPEMEVYFAKKPTAYVYFQPRYQQCLILACPNHDSSENMIEMKLQNTTIQVLIDTLKFFPQEYTINHFYSDEGYIHVDSKNNRCCIDEDSWRESYALIYGKEYYSYFGIEENIDYALYDLEPDEYCN